MIWWDEMGDGVSDNGWGLKGKGPSSNQVRRGVLTRRNRYLECYVLSYGVTEDMYKLVLRWMDRACTELQDNLSNYLVYK